MDGTLAPLLLLLLLFLPALLLYLRRRPAANNHCPHPNPVLGNALPFLRNRHRFLDWATDLLAAAPTSTIEVRGALGLGSGVATANPAVVDHFLRASFPNYVKGARFALPFEDLLGRGLFAADGRLWALQRKIASYSFSSRSLRRFSARVLRAHLHRRLEEGGELAAMFGSPGAKRRFLRDVVVSFVMAGKDSTSSALTWLFWLLAANPRCERRVNEEVSSSRHADPRRADAGEDGDGDGYDELRRMHYLHAAISEAMRLYPPVPIDSRVAVAADALPDGTAVRAGWFADYSAYAMGRMPQLWGDGCREFRPERWLNDGGEFVAVDAARYPVFHAGPRACLGREMAYVQMKAVAAAVIRRFAVEPVQAPASMETPPACEVTTTLKMKGGLLVRIRKREDDAAQQKLT
uniref:Cytochrome P450 n=1 Tax=Oryza barthii TaxID=65489 RepID=A0A0D3EYQ8_9ORYZ